MPTSPENSYFESPQRRLALASVVGEASLRRRETSEELTPKEYRVLLSRLNGASLEEIANQVVFCSKRTVKRKYLYPVVKKLGARNIAHVPRIAVENGLVPIGELAEGPRLIKKRREILDLISYGANQTKIADISGASGVTIDYHVRSLLSELGANSYEHLVMRGFQTRNISPRLPINA